MSGSSGTRGSYRGDPRLAALGSRPPAPLVTRPSGTSGVGAVARIADAVPLHPLPERDARDAEHLRGPGAVPAGPLEGGEDGVPFVRGGRAAAPLRARDRAAGAGGS